MKVWESVFSISSWGGHEESVDKGPIGCWSTSRRYSSLGWIIVLTGMGLDGINPAQAPPPPLENSGKPHTEQEVDPGKTNKEKSHNWSPVLPWHLEHSSMFKVPREEIVEENQREGGKEVGRKGERERGRRREGWDF